MSERHPSDSFVGVSSGADPEENAALTRRRLLQWSALAGAAVPLASLGGAARAETGQVFKRPAVELEEATLAELQADLTAGRATSLSLVEGYLERIRTMDQAGPKVNAVLEVNPDARAIARALDHERASGHVRGPLHGIPVMVKGNIDTGDKMQTTAGSLALLGQPAAQDSTVAARLRAAGAVILGKTNLSEFANFRSLVSSSGWSGQGGQTRNPYVLDRDPCGSSSGSGAGVSASFFAAGLGTETDGSIVCPASINGVVGIKPTVGLVSRAGVVPISHSQDTVGPHGRTVADAAMVLGALVGVDPRDPATAASAGNFHADYTQFLDSHGLDGLRVGVLRGGGTTGYSTYTDALYEDALDAMRQAGAVLVDPADLLDFDAIAASQAEITVLLYEFKQDLNAYLATRSGIPARTLGDVIAFNTAHPAQELQFDQGLLELADSDPFTASDYAAALVEDRRLGGQDGIDTALSHYSVDVLVAPTASPSWPIDPINGDHFLGASSTPSAMAGYPIVNVPIGLVRGLPVGISIMASAWSEPMLIRAASGLEAALAARRKPTYMPTVPLGALSHANAKSLSKCDCGFGGRARLDALLADGPTSFRRRFRGSL